MQRSILSLLFAAAATASAADTLIPPLTLSGEVGDGLWAYGQINKGFLVHDDGRSTEAYPLVDNANSSTRGGLWWRKKAADDFIFSFNAEAEWNPYSTGRVNRLNDGDVDWSQWRLRKAEAIFQIDGAGKLWLGQGSSGADSLAEKDLSGTGLVSYSSVADSAGGQLFAMRLGDFLDDHLLDDLLGQHLGFLLRVARFQHFCRVLIIFHQCGGERLRQFRAIAVKRIGLHTQRP